MQSQFRIGLTSLLYSFIVKVLFSNQRFIFVNLLRDRDKNFAIISQYIFTKQRRFSCRKYVINLINKKCHNISNPWRKLPVCSWLRFGPSILQNIYPYQNVQTFKRSLQLTSRIYFKALENSSVRYLQSYYTIVTYAYLLSGLCPLARYAYFGQ
jgi:hypothetical protein